MEQNVLFEEKIHLSPKDMNKLSEKKTIDNVLLNHLSAKLENRCSQHGFVIPGSLEILSRSMGHIENGTFTGNIIFHVQAQGRVYNPVNGTRLSGKILKKNKMGVYIIYKNSIRVLVPRDLHIGNDDFENLEIGNTILIEIRKSRFQIHDPFILSVGVYIERVASTENDETVIIESNNEGDVEGEITNTAEETTEKKEDETSDEETSDEETSDEETSDEESSEEELENKA